MAPFIFGARNNIHIIDLAQTVPLLHQALVKVSDVVAQRGRVLFVGTKRQASDAIAEAAKRSAQYYINHRWLGGTLTNWKTISQSIRRLKQLDETLAGEARGRTKKEVLQLTRARNTLNKSLGGIKDMGGLPGPPVRDRHQQGGDRDRRGQAARHPDRGHRRHQLRSRRHRFPDSRAMTTRAVPSRSIAISSRGPPSTASSAARCRPASMSAPPRPRPRSRWRVPTFKGIEAARGEADDLKRLPNVDNKLEQRLNDLGVYHFWQIADLDAGDGRGARPRPQAQGAGRARGVDRRGEED